MRVPANSFSVDELSTACSNSMCLVDHEQSSSLSKRMMCFHFFMSVGEKNNPSQSYSSIEALKPKAAAVKLQTDPFPSERTRWLSRAMSPYVR